MKCVLCERESTSAQKFSVDPEAREVIRRRFLTLNLDQSLEEFGICDDCMALSVSDRRELAQRAMVRIRAEFRRQLVREALWLSRN